MKTNRTVKASCFYETIEAPAAGIAAALVL